MSESDKTTSHIGLGLGLCITILISFYESCYGWCIPLTTDASDTKLVEFLNDLSWNRGRELFPVLRRDGAENLRLFILVIGFWLSFKFSEKLGKFFVESM